MSRLLIERVFYRFRLFACLCRIPRRSEIHAASRNKFQNSRVSRIGCITSLSSVTRGGHTSRVKSPNDKDRKDGGRRSASNNAAREQQRRRRRSRQRRRGQGLQG